MLQEKLGTCLANLVRTTKCSPAHHVVHWEALKMKVRMIIFWGLETTFDCLTERVFFIIKKLARNHFFCLVSQKKACLILRL